MGLTVIELRHSVLAMGPGALKMQDQKMEDRKIKDQISLGGICRTGKCRTNIRKVH